MSETATTARRAIRFGCWEIEAMPLDGARLNRLRFDGFDLLTQEPESFRPPSADYGRYETRPVYGYDDCFPGVDSCRFPGGDWTIRDHGELCWVPWTVREESRAAVFTADLGRPPVTFVRRMVFGDRDLVWSFQVANRGCEAVPFQHVMHALMTPKRIAALELPSCTAVFDEIAGREVPASEVGSPGSSLLEQPDGQARMLILRGIEDGKAAVRFKERIKLVIVFPVRLFPSLGIWWNNAGYPDEDGLRRRECALEPIPGRTSSLAEAYESGTCLSVEPGGSFSWKVRWEIVT